jgi:hypothetical protein
MSHVTAPEQAEIDEAWHDGEGWALQSGMPAPIRNSLEAKGLIRYWKDRWQLTPAGFARSPGFKAPDQSKPPSGAAAG